MDFVLGQAANSVAAFNAKLKGRSPVEIVAGTAVAMVALKRLREAVTPNFGETMRDVMGNTVLKLNAAKKEFAKEYIKGVEENAAKVQEKWKSFGLPPFTEMPEHGWDVQDLMNLVDHWAEMTNLPLAERQMSGTIYSRSFQPTGADAVNLNPAQLAAKTQHRRKLETPEDLGALAKELGRLYSHTFKVAYLWNSLHGNEFGVGDFLSYQCVQMLGNMFGGKKENMMGFVTSGGTESLMVAMRCYRNWGVSTHGHKPGEGVIIACDTVHAAVMKAGEAYNVEVVLGPSDRRGNMDVGAIKALVKKYGKRVVAIVGSGPSYPIGVVDPIKELAKIARKAGVGLHVDCCLGGFIINNLDQHDTDYLAIPGVTSLSADTHKNGWAPKGSSVLVTQPISHKDLTEVNLAYFSVYAIPGWSGGVYGTPRDPGSQQVVATLHAFLALMAIGKSGYRQLAEGVHRTARAMGAIVRKFPELRMLGAPQVNVVAWEMGVDWGKGAIYAFAHEMEHNGFTLNAIKGDAVHFCITGRIANDQDALERFEVACGKSLEKLRGLAKRVKAGEVQFPGDAGMYGMLDAALEPSAGKLSTGEYIQNWLLGTPGAKNAVRAYFMASFNPYA